MNLAYLVAVGTPCPEVGLFALDADALDAGEREIERGIELYRRCLESGTWPGRYGEGVMAASVSDQRLVEALEG